MYSEDHNNEPTEGEIFGDEYALQREQMRAELPVALDGEYCHACGSEEWHTAPDDEDIRCCENCSNTWQRFDDTWLHDCDIVDEPDDMYPDSEFYEPTGKPADPQSEISSLRERIKQLERWLDRAGISTVDGLPIE